jgi:hypothetical protein
MNLGDTQRSILRQLTKGETTLQGPNNWSAPFALIDKSIPNAGWLPLVGCEVVRQLADAGYIEEVAAGPHVKEKAFRISEVGLALVSGEPPEAT